MSPVARALVVYESMFGNTEAVARAIADGMAGALTAQVVHVAPDVSVAEDVVLLVVAAPTHAFSLSRPATRASAEEQGAPVTRSAPGLREWLDGLRLGRARPFVVAVDTRIKKRGVPGSAARAAEKRLRHLGLSPVAPATSFWVEGTSGPLLDGEVERAHAFGRLIAAEAVALRPTG